MARHALAQHARKLKVLAQLVRTTAYGICTREERIIRSLADGCTVEAVDVADEAARTRLEDEYALLNRGFNVPWGNDRHPTTIRAQAMKDQLAGLITKREYRLHRPDREYFTDLTKTEYDFALAQGAQEVTR